MSDFSQFYASGGVFMHLISLTAVAAATALAIDLRARRLGDDSRARLRLADRLVALGVGIGVVGCCFALIDFGAALTSVEDPAVYMQAFGRGMSIVPVPLAWALMLGVPLGLATGVLRHRTGPIVERARPT